MTYKENLQQMFPGAGKKRSGRQAGYSGACPGQFFEGGMTMESAECFGDCEACWNAEMAKDGDPEEDTEPTEPLGKLLKSGQLVRGTESPGIR